MPTYDVKQTLSLKDVAPPELHLAGVLLVRNSAADLKVEEASLALDDECGAPDPVLVQHAMRVVGGLPAVVEFERSPGASHTFSEPRTSQPLARLRPLGNLEGGEQGTPRLGVNAMPYAVLASGLPKVTAVPIRVPIIHRIPIVSAIAIHDFGCTTVTTLAHMV